jgi:hypothetical protein
MRAWPPKRSHIEQKEKRYAASHGKGSAALDVRRMAVVSSALRGLQNHSYWPSIPCTRQVGQGEASFAAHP